MNVWMTIFFISVGILTVAGYLAAIVVAVRKYRNFRRPSKLLLGGILLLLFSFLAQTTLPVFLVRAVGVTPSVLGSAVMALNGLHSVLRLTALGLMVTAVYVDRTPRGGQQAEDFMPGDAHIAEQDANPFAPPR